MPEDALTPPSLDLVRNEETFTDILALISSSRRRALKVVNTALVELYWQIGEIISRKLDRAEWGDGVVEELAQFIARTQPGLRGFTRANLFRMRQFYTDLPARRESRATGATIAVVAQSGHSGSDEAAGRTRVLSQIGGL
jgi:hypothetical protein